jgi:hypothetical protein
MKFSYFHIVLILASFSLYGQQVQVQQAYYTETIDSMSLQTLWNEFGKNKVLPKGFEKQFLIAASFYPDLKNTGIKCIMKRKVVPLMTYPTVFSTLFCKKENRKYKIIISNKSTRDVDSITLRYMPYNAQIGVLGHELAHISFFNKRNFWGVMEVAFGNLSKKYLDKMEYETDQSTIDHGLGWQLLAWSEYVRDVMGRKYFKNNEEFKDIDFENLDPPLEERYMHPWTIKRKIKENNIYQ